jgi:Xaa-Pro aminopeptidase
VILKDRAALITDSRYTLQAKGQVDQADFAVETMPDVTVEKYVIAHAGAGARIGYDPRLHTAESVRKLEKSLAEAGIVLEAVAHNPIDALWRDRPSSAALPAFRLPVQYAGREAQDKIAQLQAQLREKRVAGLFVASPESVAWLFNVRGRDVEHTPLVMCRAFVPVDGKPLLFIEGSKLSLAVRTEIDELADIHPSDQETEKLQAVAKSLRPIQIDPAATPASYVTLLEKAGAQLREAPDPIIFAKAVKNDVELQGARAAHKRDAVAICRFLAWLNAEYRTGTVDEIGAAQRLEDFRRETNALQDISFDTISAAGAHGAIVHYRVTRSTNELLRSGTLYLVDSGGQYLDGTTDITRTVSIGTPSPDMKRHYTLVLKAHIALATARFPKGTRGVDLDPIARAPLWAAGLDYGHGTGHGVGSYLSVHEGPHSISRNGMAALHPGMIVSIEPGLYVEGQYGIRLENLAVITQPQPIASGRIHMMGFDPLTLAPFDRQLILVDDLTADEREWLNAYHARVMFEIGPHLSFSDQAWLEAATSPL